MIHLRTIWLAALLLAPVGRAFSWSGGHEDVQRVIMERLPDPLKSAIDDAASKQLVQESHFPDSMEPLKADRMGDEALQRLQAAGIRRHYDIHKDIGRARAYLELIAALREKRMDRANFWIACIGHSTADPVACNHDPLVHIATYAWGDKQWKMQTPAGVPFFEVAQLLDLSGAARQPSGHAALEKKVDEMQLKDDGRDLNKALLEIMLYGPEACQFCASRGLKILDSAVRITDAKDPKAQAELDDNMADLGAWAAARVLRDVAVAQRLAASDVPLQIDDSILAQYEKETDEFMHKRDLLDDELFRAAAAREAPADSPAIGVLVEPTWRLNESMLGYGERVLSAEIAFTLAEEKRPYRILDVRRVLESGFPPPAQMPVIVMPVRFSASYRWMKYADLVKATKDYLAAGGRVLWIGTGSGGPRLALPEIADLGVTITTGTNWPMPMAQVMESKLKKVDGGEAWQFVRTPFTHAGWQSPGCNVVFNTDGTALRPLFQLETPDGKTQTVGVAWPKEAPQAIFLPQYALWPYFFTPNSNVVKNAVAPTLDEVGRKILDDSLALLGGAKAVAKAQEK